MVTDKEREIAEDKRIMAEILKEIERQFDRLASRTKDYSITQQLDIFKKLEENLETIPHFKLYMNLYYPFKFPEKNDTYASKKEFDDFRGLVSEYLMKWDERLNNFFKTNE